MSGKSSSLVSDWCVKCVCVCCWSWSILEMLFMSLSCVCIIICLVSKLYFNFHSPLWVHTLPLPRNSNTPKAVQRTCDEMYSNWNLVITWVLFHQMIETDCIAYTATSKTMTVETCINKLWLFKKLVVCQVFCGKTKSKKCYRYLLHYCAISQIVQPCFAQSTAFCSVSPNVPRCSKSLCQFL